MAQITSEEIKILIKFLGELKSYLKKGVKKDILLKQISVVYQQPNDKNFYWISYHRWFKNIFKNEGVSENSFLQTALDIPMSIIVNLEQILKKRHLLSRADERKLNKASRLLKEILFRWE